MIPIDSVCVIALYPESLKGNRSNNSLINVIIINPKHKHRDKIDSEQIRSQTKPNVSESDNVYNVTTAERNYCDIYTLGSQLDNEHRPYN